MPYQSYVVWNNKGRTGKTNLVFQLSCEYAKQNPDERVVVIDMCPEGSVTKALFGNTNLRPTQVTMGESGHSYKKTVSDYLMSRLATGDIMQGHINSMEFLTHVKPENENIPRNVLLMRGDHYPEVLSKRLEQERQLCSLHGINEWKRVTLFIKDFIEGLTENDPYSIYVFFIDTSPTFNIYTEMAISAAKRLIAPFTAEFRLSDIENILYLIYGYETVGKERGDASIGSQYFLLSEQHEILRPMLHMFVCHRATYYINDPNPAAAAEFQHLRDQVGQLLTDMYLRNSDKFSQSLRSLSPCDGNDFITDVHDFYLTGVISLESSCPFSELEPGYYWHNIFNTDLEITTQHIDSSKADINEILRALCNTLFDF